MAQPSYTSIISTITATTILLISIPIIPSIALQFSMTTFFNKEIFSGEIGELSYSGTCPSRDGNYTRGSDFQFNLSSAFSNLTAAAAASNTSSNATAGSVRASFYCLDNVSPDNCLGCVVNLSKVLSQTCGTKQGILYSNHCNLWYWSIQTASSGLLFPEDDTVSLLYCNSVGPKVPDPESLNRTVTTAMARLISQVTLSSRNLYTPVAADTYLNQNVYTAVQCAPEDVISVEECKECLSRALNETLQCLSMGSTQGTDYRPNCRMRYDLEAFENMTAPAPAPAPTPASSPNLSHSAGRKRSESPSGIIAAAIVLLLIRDFTWA